MWGILIEPLSYIYIYIYIFDTKWFVYTLWSSKLSQWCLTSCCGSGCSVEHLTSKFLLLQFNAFQIWKVVTSHQSHIGSRLVDYDFAIWRFRPDLVFVFHPLSINNRLNLSGGFWPCKLMFSIIGLGCVDGHRQPIKHYHCRHHLTSCSAPQLTTAGRCCWWCCCAWPSFESSRRTPVVGATLRKCVIEHSGTYSYEATTFFLLPYCRWGRETWSFAAQS